MIWWDPMVCLDVQVCRVKKKKRRISFPLLSDYEPRRGFIIPVGLSFNFSTPVAADRIRGPSGVAWWLSSIAASRRRRKSQTPFKAERRHRCC